MPYPAVPGRRMAYHRDGTVVLYAPHQNSSAGSAGGATEFPWNDLSQSHKENLNAEHNTMSNFAGGGSSNNGLMICWLFPELRDIDGFYDNAEIPTDHYFCYHSANTTNGIDGDWSILIGGKTGPSVWSSAIDAYRDGNIDAASVSATRSIRWFAYDGGLGGDEAHLRQIFIYGEIAAGETPDRLLFIDEVTGLEFTAVYDYGDKPRGSAEDYEWRLKNNSLAAGNNVTQNSIQVAAEDLYLDSAAWYTFSVGGGAFQSTLNIASLGPEAESPQLVTRRITPTDEVIGPHSSYLLATVGSLS